MQTPQGHEIINGQVVPVDWLKVIFNPSFPYRLLHMSTAAFLSSAFFVGASAAWHLLRGRDTPAMRKMLSMAMWMALIVAPVQALIGDAHGLNTLKHQPAKIAAIEGHWENPPGEATPLILVGWPDMEREETRFKLEVPYLGSLILTHSLTEQVPALKSFPPEDRPNSTVVFWSFRIMVGLGMLMILAGVWSLWLRWRGGLYQSRPFLYFILWMGPSGLLALLAGWFTTGSAASRGWCTACCAPGRGLRARRSAHEHQPAGVHHRLLLGVRRGLFLHDAPDPQRAAAA